MELRVINVTEKYILKYLNIDFKKLAITSGCYQRRFVADRNVCIFEKHLCGGHGSALKPPPLAALDR